MPSWGWTLITIFAAIVVVAVVVAAIFMMTGRRKTQRLRRHFGEEYERTVSEVGDPKTAEQELTTRQRHRHKLDVVALSAAAATGFADRWQHVQTTFIDDPAGAVGAADQLVTEVMRERGYPVDDFDQQAADISVDHPHIVENYRAAHAIQQAQQDGDVGTEQQRAAFVHYRALFEKLLETTSDTAQEASA
jgi:hypothetical protein